MLAHAYLEVTRHTANQAKKGAGDLVPLAVPVVQRLLLTLIEPPDRFAFRLTWSAFRRHHQAMARACHAARRARQRAGRDGSPQIQLVQTVNLELTDEQWIRISPLLPPQKPAIVPPLLDYRQIVCGMLWVAGTGAN